MVAAALAPKVFLLKPLYQLHKLVREDVMARAWANRGTAPSGNRKAVGPGGGAEGTLGCSFQGLVLSLLCTSSLDSVLHVSSSDPSLHPRHTHFMSNSFCDLQSKPKVEILRWNAYRVIFCVRHTDAISVFPVLGREIWSLSLFS